VPPLFTDVPDRLHKPEEVGQEPVAAQRSATKRYRTTPLRALWQHAPYFHDGSAATLADVVNHYDSHMTLALTAAEKADLVEYLGSL
jgi:cytochrome c peroxidase